MSVPKRKYVVLFFSPSRVALEALVVQQSLGAGWLSLAFPLVGLQQRMQSTRFQCRSLAVVGVGQPVHLTVLLSGPRRPNEGPRRPNKGPRRPHTNNFRAHEGPTPTTVSATLAVKPTRQDIHSADNIPAARYSKRLG